MHCRRRFPLRLRSCSCPRAASAQSDAAAAYQEGKKAFDAGKFDKARDLFTKASQTDDKNPEVFLWLGKADYQLGAVGDAIAAWSRTQALAPEEPYSAQMLKALRGDAADAETTLTLLTALVDDEQYDAAVATADQALAGKALTDAQRARVMTLRAQALLGAGRVAEVEPAVRELLVRYPAQADPGRDVAAAGRGQAPRLRRPLGGGRGAAAEKSSPTTPTRRPRSSRAST